MYKKALFEVSENILIAEKTYKMRLLGKTEDIKTPGQFVNIKLDGYYLRRPISVCDWDEKGIDLIYKVVGDGTEHMSRLKKGESLDLLTGLGNGFDMNAAEGRAHIALIGGGVGVPPLYGLAKRLKRNGAKLTAVLGFNESSQIFYEDEFAKLGLETLVTTADGSYGIKGFVTDALCEDIDYYYTCGPMPMLKALHRHFRERAAEGELSFEARMGCGFGACMGCSMETTGGPKRVCVDGPVFKSWEVSFDD